nr:hypothetical protein [Tanacetum cinerariifolium]
MRCQKHGHLADKAGTFREESKFKKFDFEGWSISITFRLSVGLQTPNDLSRSQLGFIDDLPFDDLRNGRTWMIYPSSLDS